MAKKCECEECEEPEEWMATFADAITLLMCFFVLLYAMSHPDPGKFEVVAQAMAERLGTDSDENKPPMAKAQDEIIEVVQQNSLDESMGAAGTPRGIVIELAADKFFKNSSAMLQKEAWPILAETKEAFSDLDRDQYVIEIQGHTDDSPTNSKRYPTNWELSSMRATNVLRFFMSQGIDKFMLKSSGFADTRPKVPNLDYMGEAIPQNRAANRRLIIEVYRRTDNDDAVMGAIPPPPQKGEEGYVEPAAFETVDDTTGEIVEAKEKKEEEQAMTQEQLDAEFEKAMMED